MNVYDFDNTIYAGDSTVDFWLYCIKRHPGAVLESIRQLPKTLLYLSGRIDKTAWKEYFFRFLRCVPDIDKELEMFWDRHQDRIRSWYIAGQKEDDVVISASPSFLLRPLCSRLGIRFLIASEVDRYSGRYTGRNCRGVEKTRRFSELFPDAVINSFYSDSLSDAPLAEAAEEAWLVRDGKIQGWPGKKEAGTPDTAERRIR